MDNGIGKLQIHLQKACLFEKHHDPQMDIQSLIENPATSFLQGDHYVRISWLLPSTAPIAMDQSNSSVRTRTIYQDGGKPIFDEYLELQVLHYGMEFKLDVVDAVTDRPIGTTLLSTQGILQYQRDKLATSADLSSWSLLSNTKKNLYESMFPIPLCLELRTNVKQGFGLDFFNASKSNVPSTGDGAMQYQGRAGEIVGYIELNLKLHEDYNLIYSKTPPRICPNGPPPEFQMELIQLHIARFTALYEDIQHLIQHILYAMSWNQPFYTFVCMLVFIRLCLRLDLDYIVNVFVLGLLIYMVVCAVRRRRGDFPMKWIGKERDARIEVEKKLRMSCSIHRPIGHLHISVPSGRNLRSRELGLPSNIYACVNYAPLGLLTNEDAQKTILRYDNASEGIHEIGVTSNSGLTSNPVWDKVYPSELSSRLKQLLPPASSPDVDVPDDRSIVSDITSNTAAKQESTHQAAILTDKGTSGAAHMTQSLEFPILQPVILRRYAGGGGTNNITHRVKLASWDSSLGAIIIHVRYANMFNTIPVFEDMLGEATVPLSLLFRDTAQHKDETSNHWYIEGWFRVHDVDQSRAIAAMDPMQTYYQPKRNDREKKALGNDDIDDEIPRIYVKIQLSLPTTATATTKTKKNAATNDADREAAAVLVEEMIQSAAMQKESKIGMIGTSINTINTMRGLSGNAQSIQNLLGNVLDIMESLCNVFTWASPYKSMIVFSISGVGIYVPTCW